MEVIEINKKTADFWIKSKHYSKRPSIFWKGYGLVIDNHLEGVVVYGQPSPPIQKYAFKDRDFKLLELSRLVIQTKEKNAASFLIGNSLKKLESPCAIVSYADTAQNHCGIVYQATNWLYTGATKSHDNQYIVNGEILQPITVRDRFGVKQIAKWAKENNIQTIAPKEKHRYFFFCGTKREKKYMLSKLSYPIIEKYPKTDLTRYDDGDKIVQIVKNA
jgi:hypothetical protein